MTSSDLAAEGTLRELLGARAADHLSAALATPGWHAPPIVLPTLDVTDGPLAADAARRSNEPTEPGVERTDLGPHRLSATGTAPSRLIGAMARLTHGDPHPVVTAAAGTELERHHDRTDAIRLLMTLSGDRRASVWSGPQQVHSLIELPPGRPLVLLPGAAVAVTSLDSPWRMLTVTFLGDLAPATTDPLQTDRPLTWN